MVRPGSSAPVRSPSRMIESAVRSLTEPPGLNHSHLPHSSTPGGTPGRRRRTSGVWPMASSIEASTEAAARVAVLTAR